MFKMLRRWKNVSGSRSGSSLRVLIDMAAYPQNGTESSRSSSYVKCAGSALGALDPRVA
jgi:hypothetical protein